MSLAINAVSVEFVKHHGMMVSGSKKDVELLALAINAKLPANMTQPCLNRWLTFKDTAYVS